MIGNEVDQQVLRGRGWPTRFIVTVDVESRSTGNPQTDIWGRLAHSNTEYGIDKIMEILESYGVLGTFFLNPYEIAKHGEGDIAGAAKRIHARGHDLELHTHPRLMYHFARMSAVSSATQQKVLERGIALLENWTGRRPVAHRAGGFAADLNTLNACAKVGLAADCSLSAGSRVGVPLVNEIGPSNVPRRIGRIWEIPVTYYEQLALAPWRSRRILDIEGSSLAEVKKVTRWAIRNKMPTVCLLMHSFSLCRRGTPSPWVIRRLIALLSWLLQQDGIMIQTVEETCQALDRVGIPPGLAESPTTGMSLAWLRILASSNDGWKNRAAAMLSIVAIVVLLLMAIYLGVALLSR